MKFLDLPYYFIATTHCDAGEIFTVIFSIKDLHESIQRNDCFEFVYALQENTDKWFAPLVEQSQKSVIFNGSRDGSEYYMITRISYLNYIDLRDNKEIQVIGK